MSWHKFMRGIVEAIPFTIFGAESFEDLVFYAIEDEGEIVVESIETSEIFASNKRTHSWWLDRGDRAKIVKLKLVVIEEDKT